MKRIKTKQTNCYITKDEDGTIKAWKAWTRDGRTYNDKPRYVKKGEKHYTRMGFITVEDPEVESGYWYSNMMPTIYKDGVSPSYGILAALPFGDKPIEAKTNVVFEIASE